MKDFHGKVLFECLQQMTLLRSLKVSSLIALILSRSLIQRISSVSTFLNCPFWNILFFFCIIWNETIEGTKFNKTAIS